MGLPIGQHFKKHCNQIVITESGFLVDLLKTIEGCYAKADHFKNDWPILKELIIQSVRHQGEVQFTEVLGQFINDHSLHCMLTRSERYDTGSEIGYTKAFIKYAINKYSENHEFMLWLNKTIQKCKTDF